MVLSLAALYAEQADASKNSFFINAFEKATSYEKYELMILYGEYLDNQNDSLMINAIPVLRECAVEDDAWWMRLSGIGVSMKVHTRIKNEMLYSEKALKAMNENNPNYAIQIKEVEENKLAFAEIDTLLKEITDKESNPKLQSIIRDYNDNGINPFE